MQEAVLPKIKNLKVRLYAIWTPSYTTDSNQEWIDKGMAIFKGSTVKHYWDKDQKVAGTDGFGSLVTLPRDAPIAYDVYMIFAKGVLWKEKPPVPTEYLHQVYDDGKWFEPDKFVALLKKELQRR